MNKEWAHHIERSKRMSSEPLHKAFRQYGISNFMIKEIDECTEDNVIDKKRIWIDKYKPEYNTDKIEPKIEPIEPIIIQPKVKTNKRPKPESFVSWNEQTRGNGKHFGLRIRAKNLETGICTDYESVRVASEQVTGNPNNNSNILLAARTGRTAYGHKWQLLEDKNKKKAVFGVNKKTEQIEVRYESIASALRNFDCQNKNGILKSLRNPGRCTFKGYYWFYG